MKSDVKDKEGLHWSDVTPGTRATYHFTLCKQYIPALRESTAALKTHCTLLEVDPHYVDAYLILGMNNYVVGSLP